MKFPFSALLILFASLSYGAEPLTPAKPDAGKKPVRTEKGLPEKTVISLGMTPEEVVKVIGKPDTTEAVDTPAGKGEQWTYRRLAKEWTTQTAATVHMVPSFTGLAMPNGGIGEAAMPSSQMENVKVYQVSSLLFIEGKLAAAKQWPEKERRIDN
jgi:hypothetical protein